MGTNYYHYDKPPCECCKRPFERKHIGKSSAGWCFTLHVYQHDDGPKNLNEWRELFKTGYILNEYDDPVSANEMIAIITDRRWTNDKISCPQDAESGPNGLLRHKIDGRHCIAHGEGTWDLCVGEFS